MEVIQIQTVPKYYVAKQLPTYFGRFHIEDVAEKE